MKAEGDPSELARRLVRQLQETQDALRQTKGKLRKKTIQFDELRAQVDALRASWVERWIPKQSHKKSEAAEFAEPTAVEPVHFAASADPEVSIIIPVQNHAGFTSQCLASLVQFHGTVPTEIVVIDDCSSDVTTSFLEQCTGIRAVRNESNLGFAGSCNRGADLARGGMLVFLNNDTVVSEGWLEVLLQTFRDHPKAGLVGAKLVYPDGLIQEAGGAVFFDGSAANLGHGSRKQEPACNYLSEVDYCSAACVMTPKALFKQLGGFDPYFSPCYYEDVDLCFRMRDKGWRVLYQPECEITHYEGGTAGRDILQGPKKHQQSHRLKFFDRWISRLSTHPAKGETRGNAFRILVLDDRVASEDQDAGSLRMWWLLRLLRGAGHEVTFSSGKMDPSRALRQNGIAVVEGIYWKKLEEYLLERSATFDLIILSRLKMARNYLPLLKERAPGAVFIFDTVDLHYLRESRAADLLKDEAAAKKAALTRADEFDVMSMSDAVWVVSTHERDLLSVELPSARVDVIPIIQAEQNPGPEFDARRDWLFIGNFRHKPNVDAMEFYARNIHPLVLQKIPGGRCHVVGGSVPEELKALASDSLIFTGWLPDVSEVFSQVRFSIAPLRFGAGVKGKVNQSLGFGVPVVATSVAVEGMNLVSGKDLLVADAPEAFVEHMVELNTNRALWDRLAKDGRTKVLSLFSPEAVDARLKDALARVMNGTSEG